MLKQRARAGRNFQSCSQELPIFKIGSWYSLWGPEAACKMAHHATWPSSWGFYRHSTHRSRRQANHSSFFWCFLKNQIQTDDFSFCTLSSTGKAQAAFNSLWNSWSWPLHHESFLTDGARLLRPSEVCALMLLYYRKLHWPISKARIFRPFLQACDSVERWLSVDSFSYYLKSGTQVEMTGQTGQCWIRAWLCLFKA